MKKEKIIITTGGTGGHVLPAIALAEALSEKFHIIFVTDERAMKFISEKARNHMEIRQITCSSVSGSFLQKIMNLFKISIGVFQSAQIIFSQKPKFIIGFGSYVSFPIMFLATFGSFFFKFFGINFKSIVHEQNSVMGKANAFLAKKCSIITTAFEKTKGINSADLGKIVQIGHITREEIKNHINSPYEIKQNEKMHILILGGSQGSKIFSEIVPEAVKRLPAELKENLKITQQCRKEEVEFCKKFYSDEKIDANVSHFFNNILELMSDSHLVISRSGASTIAEISQIGRPAILVPYPLADNHQFFNAQEIKSAIIIEEKNFKIDFLQENLEKLLKNGDILSQMAKDAKLNHNDAIEVFKKTIEKNL